MKLIRIGLVVVLAGFFLAPVAQAAEFIAPEGDSGTVTLPSDQTHGNVYIVGGNVTVNSKTDGDIYVAGGNVVIEGDVTQDVVAAGGTVIINGAVGGDIRVAGGTVNISGPVAGDVLAAAGTLTFSEKATVAHDVVVSGGEVIIDSASVGNIRAAGGNITINSNVLGDATIESTNLTFGPKSGVAGKITYRGENEAVVKEGSRAAGIDFTKIERKHGAMKSAWAGLFTVSFLIKILAAMLAAFVFLKLRPRRFRSTIDGMYQKTWSNLGIGVLGLIVTPIAAVILLFTFVGWYLGLIALLLYAILLLAAGLVASVFAGSLILKWLTKKERQLDWQAVVIGVVAMAILKLIPIVGWIVACGLMLIAFGALLRMYRDDVKTDQVDSPPATV